MTDRRTTDDGMTAEIGRLRVALIKVGRMSGALLADDVSTDFLMYVPDEVKHKLTTLQQEKAALEAQRDEAHAAFDLLVSQVERIVKDTDIAYGSFGLSLQDVPAVVASVVRDRQQADATTRRLREALERVREFVGPYDDPQDGFGLAVRDMIDAALAASPTPDAPRAQTPTRCLHCAGAGHLACDDHGHYGMACPVCKGSGVASPDATEVTTP